MLVLQPESLYPSLFGIPMLGEAFEFQGLAAAAAASGWLGPGSLAIMAAASAAQRRTELFSACLQSRHAIRMPY